MKANTSIEQTRLTAQKAMMTYAKAETELNELMKECDYDSESRFEFYERMDEQRVIMQQSRREAFSAVKRIADLFGIVADCKVDDIESIKREYSKMAQMLTFMWAHMRELGYKFNLDII